MSRLQSSWTTAPQINQVDVGFQGLRFKSVGVAFPIGNSLMRLGIAQKAPAMPG